MTLPGPVRRSSADVKHGAHPILLADSVGAAPQWAAEHRDAVRAAVTEHGSLLVRGLTPRDPTEAEAIFRELGALMTETEGFAERHVYAQGVYSASKWPPNQPMCVHHELSYAVEVPSLMLFACIKPATRGGATTVADAAAVLEALPADLVKRFERLGWLLVRNYNDDIGTSLASAFGTEHRGEIERYCRANAIEFEWRAGGALRTWQRRSALVRHPLTGKRSWFNQVAFLSEWTMNSEVREYLVEEYGQDELPFNTRFGDGSPIDADVVDLISETYEANTVRAPWEAGDVLLVDNVRMAHGREALEGSREVIVGMADPVRRADFSPTIDGVAG